MVTMDLAIAIAAIVVIKLGSYDGYTSEFKVKGVKKQNKKKCILLTNKKPLES